MSEGRSDKKVQVHLPYPLLIDRFDEVLSDGINPEVFIDGYGLDEATAGDLVRIREEFAARGLTVTMHGPYGSINPGSANEEIRTATVRRYERVFEVLSHLRPRTVVLHAGYNERSFKGDSALWLTQSMKTWPRFVKEAERLGVVIAVENIFEKTPDTLLALVEEIDSPNFGVCIDSGHLNVFSSVPMEQWFSSLGKRIAEVHIHDNRGGGDDHLPVGEGDIDFGLFFSLLKKYAADPVYTIEPHGEEVMRRSIKAIRKFMSAPEFMAE